MQNMTPRMAADAIISTRFYSPYGVSTLSEYWDFVLRRATAHLAEHLARRVAGTSGKQRREARLFFDDDDTLCISIQMTDARTGEAVEAVTEFRVFLDILETGADGAWQYGNKEGDRKRGQVRIGVPMSERSRKVPVGRIIANATKGQQARMEDGNPLNLRRANVYLVGKPRGCDTRSELQEKARFRADLAGSEFDYPERD
ncbi:hypothetical protein [Pseudooceanicola sp. HF7]|uniref:hypothetical protein n=1 Tax=Pseudooceanicola sp. HF7 TaxID=2721560 RepID=UPI001430E884|nr:hypothetical protein [Pseudooceanicola sp. HF7]NIZ09991.1 hypothetical protein [Pseudooceanicola sp. HF7]